MHSCRPQIAGRRDVDFLARLKHQRSEHAPNRLRKAARSVLRGRTCIRKSAVPRAGPANDMRCPAMNDIGCNGGRGGDEHEQQEPVVRASALGDRDDREPLEPRLLRQMPAHEDLDNRSERINEIARQDSGDEAQRRPARTWRPAKRHPFPGHSARHSVLGRPRKVMPNALTKQAAASAADSANAAPIAGARNFSTHCGTWGLSRIAWKVSHSETKPLNGGSAEIAAEPMRKAKAVSGMPWMSPPRRSMSRWPVAVRTAPEPKKRRLLKTEWLNT